MQSRWAALRRSDRRLKIDERLEWRIAIGRSLPESTSNTSVEINGAHLLLYSASRPIRSL
jgi:hypothetical protein